MYIRALIHMCACVYIYELHYTIRRGFFFFKIRGFEMFRENYLNTFFFFSNRIHEFIFRMFFVLARVFLNFDSVRINAYHFENP